ncbi:hypothetical protein HL033_02605 [Neoehrlichia mikurensis]|uniref:Uncharacterized protein n=1 Tax=Neoehrlichia mikurensis TaxID=89586 RepID=A0A9Q9F3V2_9RICK|nr:hypothetical protein [Neoehrlichia mikurensis]QXK91651.1 hypothetical protein IAH97_02600 [Neoehrlichia mikurensis]QXK92862.1 hypothetical protein HUN61_02595 [Neoehrlichia mikurensis]QXK93342.1 hypothetical protein HL033_02605 [Neoehrlichia mikurensis]UTO55715.1 hypothetical protein LUA82_01365 [Neoehrlichia mikurensis]UTO56632.1 hypothetical protein LUA81_01355 [Neoehrlichia mikurensis]
MHYQDAHSICRAIYQDVQSPFKMNFFDPDVKVCAAWPFCSSCTNMKIGECRYIFPTNVMTYVDDKSHQLKICACQVFACDLPWDPAQWASKCISDSIQCVNFPMAPYAGPFCNIIQSVYFHVKFVPMEFSKQSFFIPGIVIVVEDETGVHQYEKKLLHNMHVNDEYIDYDFVHKDTKYFFGASKKKDSVCIRYYGTDVIKKHVIEDNCVPIPTLDGIVFLKKEHFSSIKSDSKLSDLPIKFKDNIAYFGDITNLDEMVNKLLGVRVVQSVKDNNYTLKTTRYKCKQSDNTVDSNCGSHHVKCISFPFGKYQIKESDNTYVFINELPKILRRYVVVENGDYSRNIKCSDEYFLDLQTMTQENLNNAIVKNDIFTFSKEMFNYYRDKGITPCYKKNFKNLYFYESGFFSVTSDNLNKKKCSHPITQYYSENDSFVGCDYRYAYIDGTFYYLNASYRELEQNNIKITVRDLYDQGLCIDYFDKSLYFIAYKKPKDGANSNKRHVDNNKTSTDNVINNGNDETIKDITKNSTDIDTKYVNKASTDNVISDNETVIDYYNNFYVEEDIDKIKSIDGTKISGISKNVVVNTGDVKYIYNNLQLGKIYQECSFLKMEIWGGGQAANKIDSVITLGRPGEYVIGLLDSKKIQEYSTYNLVITIGQGGTQYGENGKSTYIELCNSKVCERLITAKGGGDLSVREVPSSHVFYHSVVSGRSSISDDVIASLTKRYSVLLPYFSLDISYFAKNEFFDYIFNHSYVLKSFALNNYINCVERKLYFERYKVFFPGAGGCVNIEKGIADIGSNGAAILTCEKWQS